MAVISMSLSSDFVMGFPMYHANLLKVALPDCDSSGVYAMGICLLSVDGFWTDLSAFSNRFEIIEWGRYNDSWIILLTMRLRVLVAHIGMGKGDDHDEEDNARHEWLGKALAFPNPSPCRCSNDLHL